MGKYTNELKNIRMNWGSDFFFGIINIYFIFSIGGLGFEIRRYTNELEDIRMNWGSIFFGRYTNKLEDIRMNWGSFFFWNIYE